VPCHAYGGHTLVCHLYSGQFHPYEKTRMDFLTGMISQHGYMQSGIQISILIYQPLVLTKLMDVGPEGNPKLDVKCEVQ